MPPLVRGAQVSPNILHVRCTAFNVLTPLTSLALVSFWVLFASAFGCNQPVTVTPQQIASLRQQQQQHGGSGPPPLLLAPRASVPNVQVQGQRIIQQGLIRVANVANSNILVNIPQVTI